MYFFKEKRLLVVFLVMVRPFLLLSQEKAIIPDTIIIQQDSLAADTILKNLRSISPDAIDKQVTYKAGGYIKNDIINKTATLRSSAEVNYGEMQIKADSIVFNMETNIVFATGVKDSTGKITGKPVFREGSQEFEADELSYNFKTHKAFIKNIVTEQEEGLLRSAYTKLLEDRTSNISKSTYSTCDADTPHFYINLPRAKIYPGKKIVSGPGNLVFEGVPLPIFIPFGYFPMQTKKAASGILMPRPHYEEGRGYALMDGGYYIPINEYFDLTLKGNLFTNGSWLVNGQTNYNRLYKYSGSFSFSYAKNITGHKGLPDYRESNNYSLGWSYVQSPKARPGSRFSANVNMSSSGFDRNNSYNLNDHITTQRQSSVSYSKTWEGTPFNLSASMNHSQNVKNKTVSLNLPKISFNASRIYPLKGRRSTGPRKWYQELQFQYSASLDNQLSTYDSLLFTKSVWSKMRSGFTHEVPVSFQLRPFKNFSISPQISYKGVLYTQKVERRWDLDTRTVIRDTMRGFFYGHAINTSVSAGYSPQIFGEFSFKNRPNSRLEKVRHVMKPTVSFSYVPSIKGLSSKMYRQVQIDTTGRTGSYSIYEGNIFGTPSLSSRNGNVSFSLTNILEAKVFARNDTTGKAKKIKLIENLGMSTSYNIFADSMRWAPISMVMRTTLFENVGISANGNFSLYGLNSKGVQIGTFLYSQNKKLMRMNNFSVGLDFDVVRLLKGNKERGSTNIQQSLTSQGIESQPDSNPSAGINGSDSQFDEYGYPVFKMPWTMNVRYQFNYSKPAFTSQISQTIAITGTLTLTKKTYINYTSGYDFSAKRITATQIMISRDLHCWDMSFVWWPIGDMKMWTFTIKVKAPVLADLKYERRKDYHDNY